MSLAASHDADDTYVCGTWQIYSQDQNFLWMWDQCGFPSLLLLSVARVLHQEEALFLFTLALTMLLGFFAFPRRLFFFSTSDLSQFTVLMGISAPPTLQHMSFL